MSFKGRIKKIGLPPGTLISIPSLTSIPTRISLLEFNVDKLIEKDNVLPQDCVPYLKTPVNTWIDIRGTADLHAIQQIGKQFDLHPLMLEDIISSEQRPKLDDYKDTLFVVLRRLVCDESTLKVGSEQISIVLGKSFIITFQEKDSSFFEPIKIRLRKENSTMRKMGPDYVAYALIDIIVDSSFVVLEKIDNEFSKLEEEISQESNSAILEKIMRAKRDIILLRRAVWPTREVIAQLRRIDTNLIQDTTKFYMHDVYDHTIQSIDTIESLRDLASSMLEIYISTINQKLNEIIKVLTIVSVIFCPLTFLTGFYGMNFEHMPLLKSYWGLPIIVAVMLLVCLYMLYFFRKKRWI